MSATTWRFFTLPCSLSESCLRLNCTAICNYVEKIQAKGVSVSDLVFDFCCHVEVQSIFGGIYIVFKSYYSLLHCDPNLTLQIKKKTNLFLGILHIFGLFQWKKLMDFQFFHSAQQFLLPTAGSFLSVSYLHRNDHGESYFCNSRDISVCMLCPLVRTPGSAGP